MQAAVSVEAQSTDPLMKDGAVMSASKQPSWYRVTGHDSPGIAPWGACPSPVFRKALLGPPRHFQKCSSTLYHFQIAFTGRHPACPGPEPGDPSHFLRACRTLHNELCTLACPVRSPLAKNAILQLLNIAFHV